MNELETRERVTADTTHYFMTSVIPKNNVAKYRPFRPTTVSVIPTLDDVYVMYVWSTFSEREREGGQTERKKKYNIIHKYCSISTSSVHFKNMV